MKNILFSLFLLLFSLTVTATAFSQFEGEILFQVEEFEGDRPHTSHFTFTAASNRLFITSQQNLDVFPGVSSDGLLVRNDLQDFIFNTGTDEALKVSKDDLDGLMNLVERFSGLGNNGEKERFDWETGVEETGKSQKHLGFDLHEFRLKGDSDQQFVSVWVTSDINVSWGLLMDVWSRAGTRFSATDLPVELIMNPRSFPLLIEVFDGGQLIYKVESKDVNTDDFDRSVVELSEQKKLLGLTDLMMNMFRQRN